MTALWLQQKAALCPGRRNLMEAWYVFHARPRCEDRASAALAVRGLTTYVPRSCAGPNRPGEPLFPAYLFVYGDLATAGMAQAHYLPGLGEIVAFGGEPARVPQPAITWLQTQGCSVLTT